jgi:branched-chain amino acid transport system ATP-binding protein
MPLHLSTKAMSKYFGAMPVTDHVSLDIEQGELHAIIGPNGAGKTTLVNLLSGELAVDAGTIDFNGRNITALDIQSRVQLGLLRSYQITSVFNDFTVRENAALAALCRQPSSFGAWQALLQDKNAAKVVDEAIGVVGLNAVAEIKSSDLAYGERRQLELAMALASQPEFLILDEPMAGMSAQESATIVDLLSSLKSKYTILLVEHDMNAVFRLADRISVLVSGKIIFTGTPDEVRQHPEVRSVYLGDEELN